MRKNEMGKFLKVASIVVIALGVVCSLALAFDTVPSSPMDDMMGYMTEPTVSYDFTQAIFGIFASVVAGLLLMGISEIIYIEDEKRENTRRLCARFGVQPAVTENSNPNRRNVNYRNGNVQQNGFPNQGRPMNQGQHMQQPYNGNQMNAGHQGDQKEQNNQNNQNSQNHQRVSMNQSSQIHFDSAINGAEGKKQDKPEKNIVREEPENTVHEDYGDE